MEERERERAQTRRSAAKQRDKVRAIVQAAKDAPCADCERRFPKYVMDLDHVRGRKEFKISGAVQSPFARTLDELRAEIEKCDVVCANCHRIRTHQRSDGNYGFRPLARSQDSCDDPFDPSSDAKTSRSR